MSSGLSIDAKSLESFISSRLGAADKTLKIKQ